MSAATLIRAATAAPEDQPASVRDRANEPDVPNVAADNKARPRPATAVRSWRMASPREVRCHEQTGFTVMTVRGDRDRSQGAFCS
jgi:hypothetical protein